MSRNTQDITFLGESGTAYFLGESGTAYFLGNPVQRPFCLDCGHSLASHSPDNCSRHPVMGCDCSIEKAVWLPKGWRQLEVGDEIREGDRYWATNTGRWAGTIRHRYDGNRVKTGQYYIRQIGEGEISVTINKFSKGYTKMDGGEMAGSSRGKLYPVKGVPDTLPSENIPAGWVQVDHALTIEAGFRIWDWDKKAFVSPKKKKGYPVKPDQFVIRPMTDREKVLEYVFGGNSGKADTEAEMIRLRDLELNEIEIPEGYELCPADEWFFPSEMLYWDYFEREWRGARSDKAFTDAGRLLSKHSAIVVRRIVGYRFIDIV